MSLNILLPNSTKEWVFQLLFRFSLQILERSKGLLLCCADGDEVVINDYHRCKCLSSNPEPRIVFQCGHERCHGVHCPPLSSIVHRTNLFAICCLLSILLQV